MHACVCGGLRHQVLLRLMATCLSLLPCDDQAIKRGDDAEQASRDDHELAVAVGQGENPARRRLISALKESVRQNMADVRGVSTCMATQ